MGRRGLLVGGAGAAAVAAETVLTAGSASAQPQVSPDVTSTSSVPRVLTDASAADPLSGLVYRTASMYDFHPFAADGQRQWGGEGVYSASTGGPMRATAIPPPGAMLKDVVFHVYNDSGVNISGEVLLFTPGHGSLAQLAAVAVPSAGTISAVRAVLPDNKAGPYPVGTVLMASVITPVNGQVQVNAARFGFATGAGATGLLPAPIRVYDSRSTTKLARRETRTITLPAANVPQGTTGVLINVTATEATHPGYLKVYPGHAPAPAVSTLNFGTNSLANAITVGISASRQLKIYTSRPVHVVVDLTGTVA